MKTKLKRVLSIVLTLLMLVAVVTNGVVISNAEETATTSVATNLALSSTPSFIYSSAVNTADSTYGVSAVNSSLPLLIDGNKSGSAFAVNNAGDTSHLVSFKSTALGGPYSVTLDLGAECNTEELVLHCYGRSDWGINPTDYVTYWTSTDNSTWTNVGTVNLADATANQVGTGDNSTPIYMYAFSLEVATTARYVRAYFPQNSNGWVNISEFEVYGEKAPTVISTNSNTSVAFSCGSSVDDAASWGITAIKSGLSSLKDGVNNSVNYWVNGSGNPYIGIRPGYTTGPYTFTMYMGGLATVRNISTYFTDRYQAEPPESVTYSVSGDGTNWTEMGTITNLQSSYTTYSATDSAGTTETLRIYKYSMDIVETDVMYVKVTFENDAETDIGFGEFEVRGSMLDKSITNLASGKLSSTSNYTYEISGGGNTTSLNDSNYTVAEYEKKYLNLLTDGSGGSYVRFYRNDFRTITIDLGSVSNVTSLWMRFADYESEGVYLPSNVEYYASEDGSDYYLVDDIKGYEATYNQASGNYALYYFKTNTVCVNARYVKIVFPVSVNCYADEIYIYGYQGSPSAQAVDLTTYEKYDPNARYVGEMPDTSLSGGVRNEYLAYTGWSYNYDSTTKVTTTLGQTSTKVTQHLLSSICYVEQDLTPVDWLFDSITFIPHHHTSDGQWNLYQAQLTDGSYYADQDDWYEWLCYAFGTDTDGNAITQNGGPINLKALENAVGKYAKATIDDPNYKIKVKLTIFPAVHFQDNWGTIDGKNIDFTVSGTGSIAAAVANRKAAYKWYIDKAIQMWEEAGFEHLELAGFYYFEEAIRESADSAARDTIMALTDLVHNTATPDCNELAAFDDDQGGKLYIYQIPFYQAEGYYDWQAYGFDYAIMQPNLSFTSESDGLVQLENCAESCEYYGLGFEMEFGGNTDAYVQKFQYYLDYGEKYGYKNTVLGWYMSTWWPYSMAIGSTPGDDPRAIYQDVYEFVQANKEALTVLGDANDNGVLSINDATLLQKYLAKIVDNFTNDQVNVSDVNGDGKVSIRDVTTIQMKIAKMID